MDLEEVRNLAKSQGWDDTLWKEPTTYMEFLLQCALRALHMEIEEEE